MKTLLIANRGEIALRIMRTAKKMGIATVAVYSDADRGAPHTTFADMAVHLGASPSSESYLDMDKVIAAARSTGADAIHPGYGFLSENAEFAERVAAAGIIFVGPRPHAIRIMGDKLAAKDAVANYDIPMVPGIDHAISDYAEAAKACDRIGYPVLIKAAAGGGGKGMRVVDRPEELMEQLERASSEAKSAFGNGAVFIEKYVASPRHIEFQVLSDTHGNHVHLFERDCSIQRRHQKVVEEAPSAVLSPALRQKMGEAAVQVARACDYVGAGTVEFLLDADHNFYFLEMNTRLQVEHPVTELITGLDLVEQQIRVARGEQLQFSQDDLTISGHAIELRVYAEDPLNDFLPSIGKLTTYRSPPEARVDDGYTEGMNIPIYYDPMIAKLIVHGATRAEAIAGMLRAIDAYRIEGVETTLPFGRFVFNHDAFINSEFDTNFVKLHFSADKLAAANQDTLRVAALFGAYAYEQHLAQTTVPETGSTDWRKRR